MSGDVGMLLVGCLLSDRSFSFCVCFIYLVYMYALYCLAYGWCYGSYLLICVYGVCAFILGVLLCVGIGLFLMFSPWFGFGYLRLICFSLGLCG